MHARQMRQYNTDLSIAPFHSVGQPVILRDISFDSLLIAHSTDSIRSAAHHEMK